MADPRPGLVERLLALTRPALLGPADARVRLFGDGLWYQERTLRVPPGARIPARMVIAPLCDRSLFVWSPLPLTPGLRDGLDQLGAVRFVVAPNTYHYLFLADFVAAYPRAELWGAPGVGKKCAELRLAGELERDRVGGWSKELDQQVIGPIGGYCEVAFLHRASGTLLLADLGFHLLDLPRRWDRLFWGVVADASGRFGPSRIMRSILRRDPELVRASLRRIAAWNFYRILVAHGAPIESGGHEAFLEAYAAWL